MVLAANLVSLIGCVLMVAVGFIKDKNRILLTQCVQFSFQGAAHLMLGAVSGLVCCLVSILRNVVFIRVKSTVWLKVGFIFLQVAMTLCFSKFSPIELLPILATVVFNWFLDTKDPVKFKIVIITAQLMWLVYDFYYVNYVAGIFDVMAVLSNLSGIGMILHKEKKHR